MFFPRRQPDKVIFLEGHTRTFVAEIGPDLPIEDVIPQMRNRRRQRQNILTRIVRRVEHEPRQMIEMGMRQEICLDVLLEHLPFHTQGRRCQPHHIR
jgi:hypothetical protein